MLFLYIHLAVCINTTLCVCVVHAHRKVLSKSSIKLFSEEEEKKWKDALKKMNAHIRYRRLTKKSRAVNTGPSP